MLKGLKHVPLDPKHINRQSLYLCVDNDGNWRVGAFNNDLEFVVTPIGGWWTEFKIKWHDLKELYQMIVPRGFVREGFSKIKVKYPKRNKKYNRAPRKPIARVLDLGRHRNPPEQDTR